MLPSTICRTIALISALSLAGACGASSSSSSSSETTQVATTAPATTAAPTTTAAPATTLAEVTDSADPNSLGATLGSAIAASLGLELDEDQQACVGDGLLTEVGGLDELANLNSSQLDSTQIAAVMAVFTDCKIDLSGMAPQTSDATTVNFDTVESARSMIIDSLIAAGSATNETATCFVDGMIAALGPDEFLRSLNSEEEDPSQDELANTTATDCGIDPSIFNS